MSTEAPWTQDVTMTDAPVPQARRGGLDAEWRRIELLGLFLQEVRQGRSPSEAQLEELNRLQEETLALRLETDTWAALPVRGLSMLEMDILVGALTPEGQPRLAWLYQALQPGIAAPYPTLALIQALFALEGDEVGAMWRAVGPDQALQKLRLIEVEGEGPFRTIRPGRGVVQRLFGMGIERDTPLGAVLIRQEGDWDDLVLAEDRKVQIREFLLWIRHRETVVHHWKGQRVGGPVALFAGPSGTGKTFAAVVIARALGWPLFRVDLGKLVSKYIGDTEKNLNRLFDAAHDQPMVLQFDEVDSIMGKRAEIREARDRYANMEVSHLLARIEQHSGPCILTTNLRDHLDHAFYRRFQVVVEFPTPDVAARALLWERLIPSKAPRDANVAPAFLAEAVSLTGGSIRNAALHAAYLAADAGRPISLADVALAVWRELTKSGKPVSGSDLGALLPYLPSHLARLRHPRELSREKGRGPATRSGNE